MHTSTATGFTNQPFTALPEYQFLSTIFLGYDPGIVSEKYLGALRPGLFLEGKWDGLIAGLDADRYDAVINQVGITEARKAKYAFSEPYIAAKAVLIVKGDNTDIKTFADLKGKVVLIVNVASKWCVGAFPVLLRRADIFPSADSRRSIRVCRRCTTSTRTRAS